MIRRIVIVALIVFMSSSGDLHAQDLEKTVRSLQVVTGREVSLKCSSLWGQNGVDIYYEGGNVGIGTTTPEDILHLMDTQAGEDLKLRFTSPDNGGTNRSGWIFFDPNANFVGLENGGAKGIGLNAGGNVGIGNLESRNKTGCKRRYIS